MLSPSEFTPTKSRILVRLNTSPETLACGLEIVRLPDSDGDKRPREKYGWVVALGPDVQDLEIGDYIVASKYDGAEFKQEGDVLMFVHEEKVLCVLEGPTT